MRWAETLVSHVHRQGGEYEYRMIKPQLYSAGARGGWLPRQLPSAVMYVGSL